MGYRTAFRDVAIEYDRDRNRARLLREKRRSDVYLAIPRVREIDEEISSTGFKIAKEILGGGQTNKVEAAEKLRLMYRSLSEEKKQLMTEHGYPGDYLDDVYRCRLCKDTGYVDSSAASGATENSGANGASGATGISGALPREYCACMKQRLISKYYDLSNLSDVLARENFDTFDLRYYSEQTDPSAGVSPRAAIQMIYRICLDFVSDFDHKFSNLLFYGDTGLGKTFLCNCIAKEILDAGRTVLYVTAPQIFKVIENYRFNRSEMEEPDEYIDAVTEVDLLIIDDLGTEFATVVTSSELFNIINTRLLDKKHTVISTNLSPADFENQYSERLTSRFFGNYRMLKFLGEDIRMKKKYSHKAE